MPDDPLEGLRAQVDGIAFEPETEDALALDATLRALREHARWRRGRRTGYLLSQAADSLERRAGRSGRVGG